MMWLRKLLNFLVNRKAPQPLPTPRTGGLPMSPPADWRDYRPLPTICYGIDMALWRALYAHFSATFAIHAELTRTQSGEVCGEHAFRAGQAKSICESINAHLEATRALRAN